MEEEVEVLNLDLETEEGDGEGVYVGESVGLSLSAQLAETLGMIAETDYRCLKWAEGELTDEEYEPTRILRHELRQKVNEIQAKMGGASQ